MARFEPVAELRDAAGARVYAEGWQSWSPVGWYDAHADSPRPDDRLAQTMGWRADKTLPPRGLHAEGLIAVELTSSAGHARASLDERRLWVSDPDCLVARPEIPERERWAAHVGTYGGLVVSGDRLDRLDDRGLELTRSAMS
jgi:hypothetical protein